MAGAEQADEDGLWAAGWVDGDRCWWGAAFTPQSAVQLGRGDATLPGSWVLAHREASFFGALLN